jgi:PAS domain S-box-containing protein
MKTPLRVLIIDDSETDALLISRAIEASFKVTLRRVETRAEMETALAGGSWNVILSDYTMPKFSGLEALSIWKERELDIPFIIVSGVADDARVVIAMRAGARDCIRKTDLPRLAPAIERELQESAARRRLTKRSLAFSKLAQSLSAAHSPQGAARIITGVADELIGWDSCFLDLYTPGRDRFYHVFDVDIVDGKRQELPPDDWGITMTPTLQKVLDEGPQLILRDEASFNGMALRPFGDKSRPSASLMIVPVLHARQVLGFLSIQSYTPKKYTPDDLVTLQMLADHCAGALERIRATEQLSVSEKRYRILFDSNPSPVFVFDRHTLEFLAVNESAIKLYGYSREEFLSMTLKNVQPAEDVPALLESLPGLPSEERQSSSGRHRKKNGGIMEVEITSIPVTFADRAARLSLVIDVTEQKKLQKEILEISAREQRRIGHDLHDGLCQHLAGLEFLSQILTDKLNEKAAAESIDAQKITQLIHEAVTKSRSLARGLFPVRLEQNGLPSALEELATTIETLFPLQCHVDCDDTAPLRDNVQAQNLYYIAHEALMNAARHGKPKNIWLSLKAKKDRTTLVIQDDGCGISHPPAGAGMGLRIMQHRGHIIGAAVDVKQHPAGGTVVACSFSTRPAA